MKNLREESKMSSHGSSVIREVSLNRKLKNRTPMKDANNTDDSGVEVSTGTVQTKDRLSAKRPKDLQRGKLANRSSRVNNLLHSEDLGTKIIDSSE